MKENKEPRKRGKGGRNPKDDTAKNRYSVNFNDVEHARFLAMFDQSGVYSKARFIKSRVLDEPFRVIKTDRAALEYITKLTSFYSQFRSVGTNYNQVVKELHSHFSEKKTLALLYKLENATKELAGIGQQIVQLSQEFEKKWLEEST